MHLYNTSALGSLNNYRVDCYDQDVSRSHSPFHILPIRHLVLAVCREVVHPCELETLWSPGDARRRSKVVCTAAPIWLG